MTELRGAQCLLTKRRATNELPYRGAAQLLRKKASAEGLMPGLGFAATSRRLFLLLFLLVLVLDPQGLKLTEKGHRKGVSLSREALVNGDAALAVTLKASLAKQAGHARCLQAKSLSLRRGAFTARGFSCSN